jgi:hypothetical protein
VFLRTFKNFKSFKNFKCECAELTSVCAQDGELIVIKLNIVATGGKERPTRKPDSLTTICESLLMKKRLSLPTSIES